MQMQTETRIAEVVPVPEVFLSSGAAMMVRFEEALSQTEVDEELPFLLSLTGLAARSVSHHVILARIANGLANRPRGPQRPLRLYRIVDALVGKVEGGEEVLAVVKQHLANSIWKNLIRAD